MPVNDLISDEGFASGIGPTNATKRYWKSAQGGMVDLCYDEKYGRCGAIAAIDAPLESALRRHNIRQSWLPQQKIAHYSDADITPMVIASGADNSEIVADVTGMSWKMTGDPTSKTPTSGMSEFERAEYGLPIDDTADITTGIPFTQAEVPPNLQGFTDEPTDGKPSPYNPGTKYDKYNVATNYEGFGGKNTTHNLLVIILLIFVAMILIGVWIIYENPISDVIKPIEV